MRERCSAWLDAGWKHAPYLNVGQARWSSPMTSLLQHLIHITINDNVEGENSSSQYINLQRGAHRVCLGYERIGTISTQMDDDGPKV